MKVRYWVVLMVFLFPFLLFATEESKQNTEGKPENLAVESVQPWLKIIDAGNYAEAWDNASAYLKNVVSKDSFKQRLQGVRNPLGKVKNRVLDSAQYTQKLPGVPDAEYVVIQFRTTFENRPTTFETITTQKENDGHWRVSGYYVF